MSDDGCHRTFDSKGYGPIQVWKSPYEPTDPWYLPPEEYTILSLTKRVARLEIDLRELESQRDAWQRLADAGKAAVRQLRGQAEDPELAAIVATNLQEAAR